MAEVDGDSGSVPVPESANGGSKQGKSEMMVEAPKNKDSKKKNPKSHVRTISCLKTKSDEKGNFDMEIDSIGDRHPTITPPHLVVMVNGIIGRLIQI